MLTTIWLTVDGVPCVWWLPTKHLAPSHVRWYGKGDYLAPYSPVSW